MAALMTEVMDGTNMANAPAVSDMAPKVATDTTAMASMSASGIG